MTNRTLIVAGTHERENEFSHSVADRLISHYGAKEPDHTFVGVDQARQGRLWLYDRVAVGKIDRLGDSSEAYLQTLDKQNLEYLAEFRITHEGLEYPPNIDAEFEGIPQWTSVSQQLVEEAQAEIYLDLHSMHAYSQIDGTAMLINFSGRSEIFRLMKNALEQARTDKPEIYKQPRGGKDEEFNITEELGELIARSKRLGLELEQTLPTLDKDQLIEIINGNYSVDSRIEMIANGIRKTLPALLAYEPETTMAEAWGDNWLLRNSRMPKIPKLDRFTFEAVHWQGRQQDAVVNFISRYLVAQEGK